MAVDRQGEIIRRLATPEQISKPDADDVFDGVGWHRPDVDVWPHPDHPGKLAIVSTDFLGVPGP
jgi:hypothetical protein